MIPQAFTIEYKAGSVNKLATTCAVTKSLGGGSTIGEYLKMEKVCAVWDTGSTKSMISYRLAERLGLIPVETTIGSTIAGNCPAFVYRVNIIVPGCAEFPDFRVMGGVLPEMDVLIGMDVITMGDFSISTVGGITKFSFHMPSVHDIDFNREVQANYPAPENKPDHWLFNPPERIDGYKPN
jgi:hypothetical protein